MGNPTVLENEGSSDDCAEDPRRIVLSMRNWELRRTLKQVSAEFEFSLRFLWDNEIGYTFWKEDEIILLKESEEPSYCWRVERRSRQRIPGLYWTAVSIHHVILEAEAYENDKTFFFRIIIDLLAVCKLENEMEYHRRRCTGGEAISWKSLIENSGDSG